MQGLVVVIAWVAAVGFALVVLGFLSYEVSWKARRLSADRAKLSGLLAQVAVFGQPASGSGSGSGSGSASGSERG